jgi:alkylation response protein AidB-like acyl-CoA dehydrogenase
MAQEFAEFHDELRSVAGDLLAKDRTVDWSSLVDAGWVGLEVPERFGGAGASFAEVAVICEEMGRAASINSYLGSGVLAVGTLKALQPSETRDRLLAEVVSGTVRLAVALDSTDFVPDAEGADRVLVLVDGGVGIAVVTATSQPVLDETRRLATVDGVEVSEVLRFDGDHASAVRRLLDRAAVAVACDSLGLCEAMLSATVAYAKVRQQFGRPIGSFQAVKHAFADMAIAIERARATGYFAALTLAEEDERWRTATSVAKIAAGDCQRLVAKGGVQLHGGIGYTWEHDLHLYGKRVKTGEALFGTSAWHRAQLADRLLQTP